MARNRFYIGYNSKQEIPGREIFKFAGPHPLQGQFPQYIYVIGPFRTLRGAKCMLHMGTGNPHIQHVNDAERIGKLYASDLSRMGVIR